MVDGDDLAHKGRDRASPSLLSTSSSSSLMSSTPANASKLASHSTWPTRIAYFFSRLACGDELPPLVRHIRAQLQQTAMDDMEMQKKHPLSSSSSSSHDSDGKRKSFEVGSPSTLQKNAFSEDMTIGGMSAEDDKCLQRAARTALFFSVESDKAQDEATRLFYEPRVAKAMRKEVKTTGKETPVLPLPPKMTFLLSERVAVNRARLLAREGRWDLGLQLLHCVPRSSMTDATLVEIHSHAGRWEAAVYALHQLPPQTWTEVEVAAAVRSLYRASREERGTTPNESIPNKSAHHVREISQQRWHHALRILSMCRENNVQLSTPSAVNDTLALLASLGKGHWVQACHVVETMLLKERGGNVRPSGVTVYHTCRAMRGQWHMALHYASLLVEQEDICVMNDREATEHLLRACVKGKRWAEALGIVRKRMKQHTRRGGSTQDEDCIRTDTLLDVIRLLNDSRKTSLASQLVQHSRLSKHFSEDAMSKSYNTMLRYTTNVTEAKLWLQTMRTEGVEVENESYEHLVTLYAREGDWERSLASLNLLLDDPQRRQLYIPSAKVHDAVQYALERAPLNGPSWEVSLQLFTRMSELHVPLSEVAFQSVVKKCFAHGMNEKAQALFQFVMRRGIHK